MAAGETSSLTVQSIAEAHRVLECTQDQPPRNQRLKGYNPLWEVMEVTESGVIAEQASK